MKLYVVTAPAERRGIYETWTQCQAAVSGVSGARFQAVSNRAEADALLAGGVTLAPGRYAFVDGNAEGGIGVVLASLGPTGEVVTEGELSESVTRTLADAPLPGLSSPEAVTDALRRLRNVFAEMTAVYMAFRVCPAGPVTLVYDYKGIEGWITGAWKVRDPAIQALVEGCHRVIQGRGLTVRFHHQAGHRSSFAGRHDFAQLNARADELATQGSRTR